jgi:hypothetical protein
MTILITLLLILITSATKWSYSITGKACNLIIFRELHFITFYKEFFNFYG